MNENWIYTLGLSLGLGLLVGFERELAAKRLAGIRTFPLVTLLGTLTAHLSQSFGEWLPAAALLSLASVIWANRRESLEGGPSESGITTEVAVLVMFVVGAVIAAGELISAVAVSGVVAVLLHWKRPLHDFVHRMGAGEAHSVMQLVLIGLVILPALPNRSFGPFLVLNPFQIWLMVVLIVSVSLGAYVIQRLLGAHVGTPLAGVLGGLVSSTATTVTYARWCRHAPERVPATAFVFALAGTVVLLRVLLLVAVVAPSVATDFARALTPLFLTLCLLCGGTYLATRRHLDASTREHEPSDLRAAVFLGLLYAAVLFGIAAARRWADDSGVYAVAALSGLTDVDAITLSSAQLVRVGGIDPTTAERVVVIGIVANTAFKAAAACVLGHPSLRRWILAQIASFLAIGAAVVGLWQGFA